MKAQHAASNQLQQLEELFRMPHMLMRILFGHQHDGCLVYQSFGAVAGGGKIYETKSLIRAKTGCKKATVIMCSQRADQQIKLLAHVPPGSMDVPVHLRLCNVLAMSWLHN